MLYSIYMYFSFYNDMHIVHILYVIDVVRCLSTENLKKPRLTKGIKKIDRLQYMKDGWSEKTPAALNLRSARGRTGYSDL